MRRRFDSTALVCLPFRAKLSTGEHRQDAALVFGGEIEPAGNLGNGARTAVAKSARRVDDADPDAR